MGKYRRVYHGETQSVVLRNHGSRFSKLPTVVVPLLLLVSIKTELMPNRSEMRRDQFSFETNGVPDGNWIAALPSELTEYVPETVALPEPPKLTVPVTELTPVKCE